MLFLTILRAEKPVQLTAGGYINLSLETFERVRIKILECEIINSLFWKKSSVTQKREKKTSK